MRPFGGQGNKRRRPPGRSAQPDEPYDPLRAGSIDGTTDSAPHDRAILRALDAQCSYDPSQDEQHIRGSARRTVFVGRLSVSTNEETLRSALGRFGDIRRMRLVRDIVTGRSQRYAFVEYEHERDAQEAYRVRSLS